MQVLEMQCLELKAISSNHFERADIPVAVSIERRLIHAIIKSADSKSTQRPSPTEMKDLAVFAPRRASSRCTNIRAHRSIFRNMGMFGIKNFDAVNQTRRTR